MSAEHVHMAKVRSRIRREIAQVEEEEHEGGELNLVPYLDIITNTVIFLLATAASAVALGAINVSTPVYSDPSTAQSSGAEKDEEDKPELNLTVVASNSGFLLGGSGGMMKAPDGSLPTIKCKAPLVEDRCPAYLTQKRDTDGTQINVWVDKYDYDGLQKMISDIKSKYEEERKVVVYADRRVPYHVVVRAMDMLRGKSTAKCTGKDGCYFDQVVLSAGVQ